MKIIIIPSATQWITWCRTIWLLDLPAKRPILSVRRLGLVTFSRNFPRIFQEIHISLSISSIESIIPIIYFSVHKLQAICILWWFQFKLSFFLSILCGIFFWYFFWHDSSYPACTPQYFCFFIFNSHRVLLVFTHLLKLSTSWIKRSLI